MRDWKKETLRQIPVGWIAAGIIYLMIGHDAAPIWLSMIFLTPMGFALGAWSMAER